MTSYGLHETPCNVLQGHTSPVKNNMHMSSLRIVALPKNPACNCLASLLETRPML